MLLDYVDILQDEQFKIFSLSLFCFNTIFLVLKCFTIYTNNI